MSTPTPRGPLAIAGSPLGPILRRFRSELRLAGVRPLPHFYLADEWGVLFDNDNPTPASRSIAVPFYLAGEDLAVLARRRLGTVEEVTAECLLPYLRHEMGHVVNYAWRLYRTRGWVKHFGDFWGPFREPGRPRRAFVSLQAQRHPDEDWAETFKVWVTPRLDWRAEYQGRPEVLAKLEYCARTLRRLAGRPLPETTTVPRAEAYTSVPEVWPDQG